MRPAEQLVKAGAFKLDVTQPATLGGFSYSIKYYGKDVLRLVRKQHAEDRARVTRPSAAMLYV